MSESIRAVERALSVLACFNNQTPELTLTQISERIGINKSTVHRLLATLERNQFLERDPLTGSYRPGIRLLQLAHLALEHNDLRRLAIPFLRLLCELHRENVNLSILDRTDVVYLEVIESPQRVKLAAAVGQRLPALYTASGKALLAYLPEDLAKKIIGENLSEGSKNTPLSEIFAELRTTAERGYSIAEQEYEDAINAVAAPIFGEDRQPLASIAIVGPSFRLTRDRLPAMGESLRQMTQTISSEIGLVALSAIVSKTRTR